MKLFKKEDKNELRSRLAEKRAVMGSIVNTQSDNSFGDPSKMAEIMNSEEFLERFGFINKKKLKWWIVTMAISDPDLKVDDLEGLLRNVGYYFMKASVSTDGFMVKEVRAIFNTMFGYGQEMQVAEVRSGKKKEIKDIL